jgi:hypothetical protein
MLHPAKAAVDHAQPKDFVDFRQDGLDLVEPPE